MANKGIVGKVEAAYSDVTFEWQIPEVFSLSNNVDDLYISPSFHFSGSTWYLQLYPNGHTSHLSKGYLSIFLLKNGSFPQKSVKYHFFLKTTNNSREDIFKGENSFGGKNMGWGKAKAIRRSDLVLRKSILASSDILTIICCLKCSDDHFVESTDASTNTEIKINTINKLQQELGELLISSTNSDVTLNVKGKHLKAHRNILAARSTVFSAMMEHNMTEKATGIVTIEDSDPETFPVFLQYLYTGSVDNVTSANVLSLYVAADKYQVDELKQICVQHMEKDITIQSFCDILTLSLRHQEEKLTELATQFFVQNSLAVAVTARWQSFAIENPVTSNELFIKALRGKKQ